jgi:membrane protease YdiL (CAAX protease family)
MNESVPAFDPPKSNWLDKTQAFVEILLVSGLLSSFLAALPFASRMAGEPFPKDTRLLTGFIIVEACITLLLLTLLLKAHRETFRDLGLAGDRLAANVFIAIAVLPVLFVTNIAVSELFRRYLPGFFIEKNPLVELIRTPRDLWLFLLSAIFAGGIKEELQRAFVITRFRQHLGGAWLGLILWSFAFAAGHYLQGLQGVVIAGVLGIVFGVVYLVRRSVVAPMVSHAAYDVIVLTGYWFTLRAG